MSEYVGRSSDYSCRRVIGGLLVVALLVLPCAVLSEGSGWAGGVGDGNLRLTVTVNGRADSDRRPPEVRVGTWVVKRYRLLNLSEADLHRVRVLDPGAPAGSVRCPAGPLPAAEEVECTARFRAVAGNHVRPVRAEGDVPSLRTRLTATARAGYVGVAGVLRLTEEVVIATPGAGSGSSAASGAGSGTDADADAGAGAGGVGGVATVTYTVTNRGNLPLYAVRVEDPGLALAPGAPDCGGQGGTVAVLAPDTSALCRAALRLRPGTYRSTGRASGTDRATTFGAGGERVSAPVLTAGTSAVFVVREPPAPRTPAPRTPAPGAVGAGAGNGGTPGAPGAAGALAGAGTGTGTGAGTAPGAAGRSVPPAAPAVPGAGAVPGAVPPGAAPPDGVPPGAVPPSAVSPGTAVPPPVPPPGLRRADGLDDEGFLGRVRRRAREAREFGVATTLLLLLIPAAVAAALLGSRRK
ncbi:hypothetical protein [Streptomyces sp. NPDC058861]|uniref:hypothetical protein n=1 Tax=Streptomyces sp. NPDC058861 TaxID=3346653 RepID=UPI0036950F3A